MGYYDQDGYAVRLEWGMSGVGQLAPRCAVLVIVDVLVFSTSVNVALGRGARVLPLPWRDERAAEAARQAGAVLTRTGLEPDQRGDPGEPTLRPSSLVDLPAGTFLAISSLNGGSLCAAAAATGTTVLAGCLRNATAVGAAARELAGAAPVGVVAAGERWGPDGGLELGGAAPVGVVAAGERWGPDGGLELGGTAPVGVVAAGERWGPDGGLRPSVEDLLGAGAVAGLPGRSPEAELARLAYIGAAGRIGELLAECGTGRELAGRGVPADVPLAAEVDCSDVVPILVNGVFEPWTGRSR